MDMKEQIQTTAPQVWIRPPVKGRCPHTGFSRSMYYQLIQRGAIRSASIKQPGKLTGTRLIWLPSVFEFIEKHIERPGE